MGGSTGGIPGTGDSQIGSTGGTTGFDNWAIPPAPSAPPVSVPGMGNSQIGNTGGTTGLDNWAIPPPAPVSVPGMGNSQIGNTGGTTGVTGGVIPSTPPARPVSTQQPVVSGRPLAGGDQFYQPIYQPQYQNYNVGNPMSISQYGQMNTFNPFMMQGRFNPYTNTMQSPFSFQPQFQPQMSMGMQTPFSSGMSQPAPQRVSSGPARAIVGRSSGMRGTPNVMMRRAEGGITSLVGAE